MNRTFHQLATLYRANLKRARRQLLDGEDHDSYWRARNLQTRTEALIDYVATHCPGAGGDAFRRACRLA